MSGKESSQNDEGVFEPFSIESVPWEEVSFGERFGMKFQHLSSYGGGEQISVSNEILPPGRQANQHHYHLLEEEHLIVLEGSLTLRLGDERFVLSEGHYACFPAGQELGHSLYNHTSEDCRYLIIGNPQPHDVAVFPETERVAVKLMQEGYRGSATIEPWEGVED